MKTVIMPENYAPALDCYELQCAISYIKSRFQTEIEHALNLRRVSAPLFVDAASGLNDNLNGTERPVSFDIPAIHAEAQVVHSLAKWKRVALKKYGMRMHEGLYTDMNAIRRDEAELDNMHSVYVDQWDWEKIISAEDRNLDYLYNTVRGIVNAIVNTSEALKAKFPSLKVSLCRDVTFITSQELADLYPALTPEQREYEFLKIHKTAFVSQIGDKLSDGKPHGLRAPDYDDWQLNGDILFWDDVLQTSIEISSMGIRVSPESLDKQLTKANCDYRRELPFHKALLNGELPLTIGGGIGQSRLCMLLLGCAHIGEVQVSLWDKDTVEECGRHHIFLL